MKTVAVELTEATASLSDYARRAGQQTVVVTRKGKPVATLIAAGSHTDLENVAVTTDPAFVAMIERSRRLYPAGTGLTTEQVREQLGLEPPKPSGRRRKRRSRRRS